MKSGGLDYVDPLASENAKKKKKLKKMNHKQIIVWLNLERCVVVNHD